MSFSGIIKLMDKKLKILWPVKAVILLIFCLITIGLTSQKSLSQKTQPAHSIVAVKPILSEAPVTAGDLIELTLELTIAPGYHLNSAQPEDQMLIPASVEFKKNPAYEIKEIIFPEARKKKFKFSDRPLSVYEGTLKIKVKIELAEDVCGSNLELEGKVRFQACDEEACLRPASVPFKVVIKIAT